MQIIQILDASSKWRSFFNKRKLKGKNKSKLLLVELWQYSSTSEEKPKPSALRERSISENSLWPYVTCNDSIIYSNHVISQNKNLEKIMWRQCNKKGSCMKLIFKKRQKKLLIIYKFPILFGRKYYLCLGCNSQLRLFRTDFLVFCIWTT